MQKTNLFMCFYFAYVFPLLYWRARGFNINNDIPRTRQTEVHTNRTLDNDPLMHINNFCNWNNNKTQQNNKISLK